MNWLAVIWRLRQSRYIIIGGSVYLLEVVVILVMQQLGASSVLAVGTSFWLGLLVSFVLQKTITFQDKRYHHKVLGLQLLAVTVLVLWNFGFTLLVTYFLQAILPAFICRALALGITTIWNFYLYKTHIFKNKEVMV